MKTHIFKREQTADKKNVGYGFNMKFKNNRMLLQTFFWQKKWEGYDDHRNLIHKYIR